VALVVANMIGSGVFVSSGYALFGLQNRSFVMLAWAVGGAIALCGAISYGGLVRHITESGGEYLFLSRTIHPLAGFLAGWVSLLAGFTGAIAFAAFGFAKYAAPEHPDEGKLIAVGLIVILGLLHLVKKPGVLLQNAIVAIKILVIGGFVIFATVKVCDWPGRQGDLSLGGAFNLREFATTVMWISLAYSGFNAAIYISSEVKDAERNVPRSMWIATILVTVLYLLLNWVFVYGPEPVAIVGEDFDPDRLERVAMIAAEAVGGSSLAMVLRITICLALASSVSSMVIAGPRVYAKMADDGVFPAVFRFGQSNPASAILLQVVLAAIVVMVSTLNDLMNYLSLVLSLSSAATVASIFILRKRSDAKGSLGVLILAAIFVLVTLVLAGIRCTTMDAKGIVLASVATVVSGVIAFYLIGNKNSGATIST
jgi:APA family basic amino acid/polyamine antiporter